MKEGKRMCSVKERIREGMGGTGDKNTDRETNS